MCGCSPDVEVGTYLNQVVLNIPDSITIRYNTPESKVRKQVSVDACLADEIMHLWERGIITTGCCCGHNKGEPYIGVLPEFERVMVSIGYKPTGHESTFYPKTIKEGE